MLVNRKEFLNVLTKIKPGLADKSFIEHSENFIFDKNIIYTNNNEIAIIQNFETGIKGAVFAKKFYELISKLKEDKLSLKEKDNEVFIKCGKTRAGVKIKKEIPPFPIKTDNIKFEKLPNNFLEGLKLCSFSVSKDLNKFPLNYLYIKENEIIGCDNFRLTHFVMNRKVNKNFLFPLNCIDSLSLYNPIKYCIDNQIYFADKNNTIFVISNVEGNFPETKQLLKVEGGIIFICKIYLIVYTIFNRIVEK